MPGMNLDSTWREAKAGLSMTDGESYVVEFHGPVSTVIRAADIEGAGPPTSDEDALVHFNRDKNPLAEEPLEFEARSGWTWWLKTDGGASRIVAAKIGT